MFRQISQLCFVAVVAFSLSACTPPVENPNAGLYSAEFNKWDDSMWQPVYQPPKASDADASALSAGQGGDKISVDGTQHVWKPLVNYDQENFVPRYANDMAAPRPELNGFPTPVNGVMAPIGLPGQPMSMNAGAPVNMDVVVFPIDEVFGSAPYRGDVFGQGGGTAMPHPHQQPTGQMAHYNGAYPAPVTSDYQNVTPMQTYDLPQGASAEMIYFKHGSARLGAGDQRKLKALAEKLQNRGKYAVRIVGHASKQVYNTNDPVTKRVVNLEMAMKRAGAVSAALYRAGLKPEWVETVSHGDNQSYVHHTNDKDSRRVDVLVK